jgi:choline dehydrogenase-like flavoprotein
MSESPADVLIVGAGAAGGVAARYLAEAGLRVVCLEQGQWPDRTTLRGAEADWELAAMKEWSGFPEVRKAPGDYPIDVTHSDMGVVNYNGVGGSTVLYAAQWHRMMPADFQVETHEGVGADWPISYADLQPFYERTDRDFGVSGMGGNPAYPPGAEPPLPALPIGAAGLRVARAHARLGWHWWPETQAILSAPYDGRHSCVRRGVCMSGCAEGAKASTDLTHWPKAVAAGAKLVTGARVARLLVDERGLVNGAEWVDPEGAWHFQPANVVLCAANGVGTARLLLASTSRLHPDGLANSSGLVGRNLMRHPVAVAIGLFDEMLGTWQGQNGGFICSTEFYASDPSRGFIRGSKWSLSPTGGPLGLALGGGVWGSEHHVGVRTALGRGATWQILGEDLPDPDNRVVLSDHLVDSSGLPAPELHYRYSENSRRLMDWHMEKAAESLREAGAVYVQPVPGPGYSGHTMGTARMGDDSRTSVVDGWCMSHDVRNLGVIDSSVFPTVGGLNPTSTLVAVALRAVEHLVETRQEIPRPLPARSYSAPSWEPVRTVAPSEPASLDIWQREALRAVAGCLIPGTHGMPSAADCLMDQHIDRALRVLADGVDLAEVLTGAASDSPVAWFDELLARDPESAEAVRLVVAGAYYMHPQVRAALGYPGQEALPVNALEFPVYLEEGLLDGVLARAEATTKGVMS